MSPEMLQRRRKRWDLAFALWTLILLLAAFVAAAAGR